MTEPDESRTPAAGSDDSDRPGASTTSKAAFLGGLLGFGALVALSLIGVGHARTISGSANTQYWILVTGLVAALGFVLVALARTPARSRAGEAVRRIAVPVAAIGLALFLWEAVAIGAGAFSGPLELAWTAWRG